jgi:hypothetical protein
MTVDEYLGDFSKVAPAWRWSLKSDGKILGTKVIGKREHYRCPIMAYYEACYNSGICEIMYTLMLACDNKEGHDPEIRKKILSICGLTDGTV